MKKSILIISCIAILQSCTQEEIISPFGNVTLGHLTGQLLVCDSVRTVSNGTSTLQIVGKGKGRDLTFGNDGKLTVYSNPVTVMIFQTEGVAKIYYWTPPASLNTSQFFTIKAMTEKNIQLEHTEGAGSTVNQYFTVE